MNDTDFSFDELFLMSRMIKDDTIHLRVPKKVKQTLQKAWKKDLAKGSFSDFLLWKLLKGVKDESDEKS